MNDRTVLFLVILLDKSLSRIRQSLALRRDARLKLDHKKNWTTDRRKSSGFRGFWVGQSNPENSRSLVMVSSEIQMAF